MAAPHIFLQNLDAPQPLPENGILSRTLQNDDRSKIIHFTFAPGSELSAHTAPFPATLYFIRGEASLTLGDESVPAAAGSFAYMPPNLEHAIKARTETVMLLSMWKNPKT